MAATGLRKGGLYNHFVSKEALALEAFDYAFALVDQRIRAALAPHESAPERLRALVAIYLTFPDDAPIPGGCPVHNAAIEADDTHPLLRDRARQAMTIWRELVRGIVREGVARGQLRADLEPDDVATVLLAALQGAILLINLYRDPSHMQRVADHLRRYIDHDLCA